MKTAGTRVWQGNRLRRAGQRHDARQLLLEDAAHLVQRFDRHHVAEAIGQQLGQLARAGGQVEHPRVLVQAEAAGGPFHGSRHVGRAAPLVGVGHPRERLGLRIDRHPIRDFSSPIRSTGVGSTPRASAA